MPYGYPYPTRELASSPRSTRSSFRSSNSHPASIPFPISQGGPPEYGRDGLRLIKAGPGCQMAVSPYLPHNTGVPTSRATPRRPFHRSMPAVGSQ